MEADLTIVFKYVFGIDVFSRNIFCLMCNRCSFGMTRTGYSIMTSVRSVCMNIRRASGAGLCGLGSITLSGVKVDI